MKGKQGWRDSCKSRGDSRSRAWAGSREGGMTRRRAKMALAAASLCFLLSGCRLTEAESWLSEQISAIVSQDETDLTENFFDEKKLTRPEEAFRDTSAPEQTEGGEPSEPVRTRSFDRKLPLLYAYGRLSEAERIWYRAVNDTLAVMGTDAELPREGIKAGLDEASLEKIFQCVLDDHPEYFYVEGYNYVRVTMGDVLSRIEFSGTYTMDPEEAEIREEEIRSAAEAILAGVRGTEDEYLCVKYLYETLIHNTEYDINAPDNQNIYSVLVGGASVCQGYAKTLQYLLGELGMEAALVGGRVLDGELHAWNLVRIDGAYYYVDATWGDTSYDAQEGPEGEGINYEYLCVTTRMLEETHTIESRVEMPLCTSMEANFYVREGMYATDFDTEWLRELFDRAKAEGRSMVWIKCADQSVYEEMKDWLIRRQRIFDYLQARDNSLSYGQSDRGLLLTFWVSNS